MALFKKHSTLILFLIVLFVAIFFRFWKIQTIPFGLNNDAAWEGSAAIEILKGHISEYFPYAAQGWRGEGIIRVIVAFFMIFLGKTNPLTIRLATDIFGVGLIIAVFFLIKQLFNQKLALLSSFFVAISGWHITFSKSGWRTVTVPFFTTLLFYFFFKGIETKKKIHFIVSGIMLSLVSLYTYDAARIVPVFFIFWLLLETLSKRSFLKNYGKSLIILLISFLMASLPMIFYASNNWQNFTSRSDFLFVGHQIAEVGNFSPLINNLTTSIFLFNVKANGNDFFIFDPLVDQPVAYLLPLGFIVTLCFVLFRKNKKFFFMLAWFLASLIPGILSVPNGNRAIGAIPSVYFFAAVGIFYPLMSLFKRFPFKLIKAIICLLVILFCSYSAILTYQNYLGPNRKELAGFYPETYVTTNYIKTIWNSYDIYITDNYPRELLTYYLYRPYSPDAFAKNYTWYDTSQAFLDLPSLPNSPGFKGKAFFMFDTPDNENVANSLISKFPNSNKFHLWYTNDNINRVASLVVLVNR